MASLKLEFWDTATVLGDKENVWETILNVHSRKFWYGLEGLKSGEEERERERELRPSPMSSAWWLGLKCQLTWVFKRNGSWWLLLIKKVARLRYFRSNFFLQILKFCAREKEYQFRHCWESNGSTLLSY